jgi:hypothetical protein
LVEGRVNRKWKQGADKTIVNRIGKRNAYKQTLLGLGAIEKLTDKKFVDKLTERPDAPIVLAKADDKRQAIDISDLADEFDVVK